MAFALLVPGAVSTASAADCTAAARPGIDWSGCNRKNLSLAGANLERAALKDTDFGLTDLTKARLTSANLEEAELVRSSLAGASADGANFTKVEAYRTDFSAISAVDASFRSAELQRANFTGAVLTGSNFEKAELGRANFAGAELADNMFGFANLARAIFSGARIAGEPDFTGAYMFLTRIEGSDLSAAKGLDQMQIDLACGDDATVLPQGLVAPASWPCAPE
ncbi:pentapeptide repeat-containing protein [Aurantimonas aggregata]|uniref:pentapeptide repeat-containing protein n=1 Tax=Aurantimonas aggregata TaxID=2047720 RepID=UPI001FE5C6F6|nr:pentapeptide repeat-containing protein [Aurantimonas aggregata]